MARHTLKILQHMLQLLLQLQLQLQLPVTCTGIETFSLNKVGRYFKRKDTYIRTDKLIVFIILKRLGKEPTSNTMFSLNTRKRQVE